MVRQFMLTLSKIVVILLAFYYFFKQYKLQISYMGILSSSRITNLLKWDNNARYEFKVKTSCTDYQCWSFPETNINGTCVPHSDDSYYHCWSFLETNINETWSPGPPCCTPTSVSHSSTCYHPSSSFLTFSYAYHKMIQFRIKL